jgi:DNA mismatch endonuclease (patch repair protein)
MTDVFSKRKRSEIMSRVKGRGNEATEARLVHIFREHAISGWRRSYPVFGNPDFVFPESRLCVFVDGCFWHGCKRHGSQPTSNRAFWRRKLARNKSRDRVVNRTLRTLGWRVVRIWQHELLDPEAIVRRVIRAKLGAKN